MEYVARSPVMSESSSVFVAYLGILTALAQGETGAEVPPPLPNMQKSSRAAVSRRCDCLLSVKGMKSHPERFLSLQVRLYDTTFRIIIQIIHC